MLGHKAPTAAMPAPHTHWLSCADAMGDGVGDAAGDGAGGEAGAGPNDGFQQPDASGTKETVSEHRSLIVPE